MYSSRLKILHEKFLSMKITTNEIDLKDAKRFDSFQSVIFNCKTNVMLLQKS